MVILNTCPNLSNIVHTDFELGRVIQTVTAADCGITDRIRVSERQTTSNWASGSVHQHWCAARAYVIDGFFIKEVFVL